jgi:hypothetical protein
LFDRNAGEVSIGEQDSERRFILVEFVLGDSRIVDQIVNSKCNSQNLI